MPEVLPSRARQTRKFAAIVLFAIVYLGVLTLVFAPRDMISANTGAVFAEE